MLFELFQKDKFVFEEGRHWKKVPRIGFMTDESVFFEAIFDESCLYVIDGEDHDDINKLFGYSNSWNHHKDSIRFGWNPNEDGTAIEIFSYSYVKGVRRSSKTPMMTINPGDYLQGRIVEGNSSYHLSLVCKNRKTKELQEAFELVNKNSSSWFKYLLYPYIGGTTKAVHRMSLTLRIFRDDGNVSFNYSVS